jgi:hypothetical protein
MDLRELSTLPERGDDRGRGLRWLVGALVAQATLLVVALGGAFAEVEPPAPPPMLLGLSAAAVVEPGDGGAPGALGARDAWPADSRVQLTFEVEREAWTAVLWFDGQDRVVPLYPSPSRGQTGWTVADQPYVLPSEGAFLRLTSTGAGGDFVAVVSSARPDREVERILRDPQPAEVRSLRRRLEQEAGARTGALAAVERFLPTADGRAVAVPWKEIRGTGRLVLGWDVQTD